MEKRTPNSQRGTILLTYFFSYPITMMDSKYLEAVKNLDKVHRKRILDAFDQLEKDLEEIVEAKYPSPPFNNSKFIPSNDDKFFTKETKQ